MASKILANAEAPVTPYDGCGKCLLGLRRLSRVRASTSSPVRQMEYVLAAAVDAGGHIIGWADDWEVSGATDPNTRPQLGPWLLGQRGPFDGLVASAVDRIGRDVLEGLTLARDTSRRGQLLVTADHRGIWDLQDPNQESEFTLKLFGAQIEHRNIRERNRQESQRARAAGQVANKPSYGYRHVRPAPTAKISHTEIDPESAEVIREVARRILADESGSITPWTEIHRLTRAGVPNPGDRLAILYGRAPKGAPWRPNSLVRILTSEAAMGYLMHGRRAVIGDDGMPVRIAPPLWDRATHDALVAKLGPKRATPRKRPAPRGTALLSYRVKCGVCGHTAERAGSADRIIDGKRTSVPAWGCRARTLAWEDAQHCKPAPSFGVAALDAEVESWFLGRFGAGQLMQRVYDPGNGIANEIAEHEVAKKRLRADRQAGLYESEEDTAWFQREYKRISEKIEELKKEPQRPAGWYSVPTGRTVADEWRTADTVARREMLEEHGVVVRLFPRRGKKAEGKNHPTGFEISAEIDHDPAGEIAEPPKDGGALVPGSKLRIHEPASAV
ncbi:recombinase family protein [Kitasatospora cathayae]|uniref:Recombinase family protein n=1 Tax=Kitasatospora cathayae TaxID=3004092 RepID=A0ABY7QAC9_9ACTN|nr:recombinase family protein [Kitasatospora sp. HUAS 3-15]WBP89587.1 recombinase family protein [Kitasatospora sp. HUAS 3-15]